MSARILGLALALLLGATVASAQVDSSIAAQIQLSRSDVRAQKKEMLRKALVLPDAESKVFWRLYQIVEADTKKLWDERLKIIQDYVATHDTLSNAAAGALVQRMFAWDEKRLKLNRDHFVMLSKELPGKTVAHFFQLDGFLNRAIEMQLASALPEVRNIK